MFDINLIYSRDLFDKLEDIIAKLEIPTHTIFDGTYIRDLLTKYGLAADVVESICSNEEVIDVTNQIRGYNKENKTDIIDLPLNIRKIVAELSFKGYSAVHYLLWQYKYGDDINTMYNTFVSIYNNSDHIDDPDQTIAYIAGSALEDTLRKNPPVTPDEQDSFKIRCVKSAYNLRVAFAKQLVEDKEQKDFNSYYLDQQEIREHSHKVAHEKYERTISEHRTELEANAQYFPEWKTVCAILDAMEAIPYAAYHLLQTMYLTDKITAAYKTSIPLLERMVSAYEIQKNSSNNTYVQHTYQMVIDAFNNGPFNMDVVRDGSTFASTATTSDNKPPQPGKTYINTGYVDIFGLYIEYNDTKKEGFGNFGDQFIGLCKLFYRKHDCVEYGIKSKTSKYKLDYIENLIDNVIQTPDAVNKKITAANKTISSLYKQIENLQKQLAEANTQKADYQKQLAEEKEKNETLKSKLIDIKGILAKWSEAITH